MIYKSIFFLSLGKEFKILEINKGINRIESITNSPARSLGESYIFSTVWDEAKVSNESEDDKEDIFSPTNDTQAIGPLDEGNVNDPGQIAQTLEPQNKTIQVDESITTLALYKTESTEQLTNCCPKCNKRFKYIHRLAVHMKRGHSRTKNVKYQQNVTDVQKHSSIIVYY